MGSTDYGTQKIRFKFFEAAKAIDFNELGLKIIPTGIYQKGYLTRINDTTVTLSPLVCLISEGDTVSTTDNQVRIETTVNVTVTVSTVLPYVILRWEHQESVTNYMDVLAVAAGSIRDTDLIVGKCVYAGSTLTGFDYSERNNPQMFDPALRVEALATPNMQVRIRGGNAYYGDNKHYTIYDQITTTITAPTSNPRIDVVYVDDDGLVKVYTGSEAASPVRPDTLGKAVLASIYLTTGMTEITNSDITDLRVDALGLSDYINSDELVKVSSNDTTSGYLNGKLVAGTGITLTENNNGSNETLTIATSSAAGAPDYDSGWLSQPADATLRNVAHGLGGLPSRMMVMLKDSAGYTYCFNPPPDRYDLRGIYIAATTTNIYYRKNGASEEFMAYYNSSNTLVEPTSGDVRFLCWT